MMVAPNPFKPTSDSNTLERPNTSPPIGRVALFVLASIVATVPFLGYHVRATQNDQMVAFCVFLAWVAAIVFAVVLIFTKIACPTTHRSARVIESLLLMYILVASLFGLGGVRYAFMELLAG